MNKFYGDIEKINCKYLLEATPFRIDPKVNFLCKLNKEVFFTHLYKEASSGINYKENELFNRKVSDTFKDVENKYAKVEMIHVAGYGGCGKTTFVRHLLWNRYEQNGHTYEIVDYEGTETAMDPLLVRVSYKLKIFNSIDFIKFISSVANEEIFNMNRFHNCLYQMIELTKYLKEDNELDQFELKNYLKSQVVLFEKVDDFLAYLLTLDFVMLLYGGLVDELKKPFIILIDNVDSLSDLHEESILISAIKDFITNCNFFFGQNINCKNTFGGKPLYRLVEKTKLV